MTQLTEELVLAWKHRAEAARDITVGRFVALASAYLAHVNFLREAGLEDDFAEWVKPRG